MYNRIIYCAICTSVIVYMIFNYIFLDFPCESSAQYTSMHKFVEGIVLENLQTDRLVNDMHYEDTWNACMVIRINQWVTGSLLYTKVISV